MATDRVGKLALVKKRTSPSYRFGVEWIALNDEPGCDDAEVIADSISVMLLADLFGKAPADVAKAILRVRAEAE